MPKRSIGHIRKIEDGKYFLRLSMGFDDFGKRLQPSRVVQCSSDRDAERMLQEFYQEQKRILNKKSSLSRSPSTLAELYHIWMENHVKINLEPKTVDFYTGLWNRNLITGGKLKLSAANAKNIHTLLSRIQKPRTQNAAYKMLKGMFNKAIKWGYITSNPCDMIDTPKYKPTEKKILSQEDISHIMTALPNEPIEFQALFYFAAICGMRRQEIVGLKWEDINFADKTFIIKRAATRIKGQGTTTKDPKTKNSARLLFFPAAFERILLRHMNQQADQRRKCGEKWHHGDWIFTQWDGKIMDIDTPTHLWEKFSAKMGIDGVTFHGLRHTAATFMIKNNVPISTVSGVLGHAQISTTLNTYTHVIEDTKRAAINTMSSVYYQEEAPIKKVL